MKYEDRAVTTFEVPWMKKINIISIVYNNVKSNGGLITLIFYFDSESWAIHSVLK